MPPKILLVDDDALMHLLYRPHLERAGYQLLSARDGVEAVATAAREIPQLILMDVMMPKTDGLTALRELKKAEATKSIPVIVITANVNAYIASRQDSELSGAAGFLSKPLSPAQLVKEIQRLVPA
jgi:CheY-like chemotaxis protein